MSVSRTADIFGNWGDIRINTYISGLGQAVESLLNAKQFAGNSNGLRRIAGVVSAV
jgi:hypothetical protein